MFLVYGKNACHKVFKYENMRIIYVSYNFLYAWNYMEWYGKKFFLYETDMISLVNPSALLWSNTVEK